MEENLSRVYIRTDAQGRITRCEGGYTTPDDLTGWTEIDVGSGDRYNLCQAHYFNGGLYTDDGLCRWRWDGESCVLRTAAELEDDRADMVPAPTEIDRIASLEAAVDALIITTLEGEM